MRLQFGHACLRVETIPCPQLTDVEGVLQFGHACLRVETTSVLAVAMRRVQASIRPRLLARGDHIRLAVVTGRDSRASIRPRLLARGDQDAEGQRRNHA